MKTKKTNQEAAAAVLGEIAETPEPETGKPGLPNADLPEPEPEDGDMADYEPDVDEDEEGEHEEHLAFSEKDERDLPILENRASGGLRESAQAYREIRVRQLWKLLTNHAGEQRYSSFDEYCSDRLGHSRQWVTHLTNWLRVVEELERLGMAVPHLTVKAAQGLLTARLDEAGGLRAVLQEAKEDGVPLDRDHLREIVLRRADFSYLSDAEYKGDDKPAAKTYAEYKNDLAAVKEMGSGPTDYGITDRAKALDGDFAENLVALCQQEKKLPSKDRLLAGLTGDVLKCVVGKLKTIAEEQAEIKKKKDALAARRKELRERQKDASLKTLKEEVKALEQDLKAKEQTGSSPTPKTEDDGDESEEEPETIPDDQPESDPDEEPEADSDVYSCLDNALVNLDDALLGDWPEDAGELDDILLKAQDCEEKLAEIVAKAKEMLAEVDAREAILSDNE